MDVIASPCHTVGHVLFACRTKTRKGGSSSIEAFGSDPIDIEAEDGWVQPCVEMVIVRARICSVETDRGSPVSTQFEHASRSSRHGGAHRDRSHAGWLFSFQAAGSGGGASVSSGGGGGGRGESTLLGFGTG